MEVEMVGSVRLWLVGGFAAMGSLAMTTTLATEDPLAIEIERVGDRIAVTIEGEPFTDLRWGGSRPYLYPVIGPSGQPMTRGFPMDPRDGEAHDHPHHRSLWFAHGDVNGHDLWSESDRAGRVVISEVEIDAPDTVRLSNRWETKEGKLLCEEDRVMRFSATATERRIDVTATLRATAGELRLGDTKEGTMALRSIPELRLKGDRAKGRARNSEGVTGKALWGKRARWVHYEADLGESGVVGFSMLDHPENPRHPTWWHARDYGLVAANPFGVHDFEGGPAGTGDLVLAAGDRVTFRYRVVFHAGARDDDALNAEFASFATMASNPLHGIGPVEKVAGGFQFTEGPVWRASTGELLFTDIPADRIYKVTPSGEVVVHLEPSGNANGLWIDAEDRLWICEHGGRRVSRQTGDDAPVTVADRFGDGRFHSPNDLVIRWDGTVFFTDPPFGLGDREPEQDGCRVYRRSPDGEVSSVWDSGSDGRPNGIRLSPDERVLYVARSREGDVLQFDVAEDATTSAPRPFAQTQGGADGMATDAAGNLYVTSRAGVEVFAPDGRRHGVIEFPEKPANCAFGGADGRTLYVTARTSVYRVRLPAPPR